MDMDKVKNKKFEELLPLIFGQKLPNKGSSGDNQGVKIFGEYVAIKKQIMKGLRDHISYKNLENSALSLQVDCLQKKIEKLKEVQTAYDESLVSINYMKEDLRARNKKIAKLESENEMLTQRVQTIEKCLELEIISSESFQKDLLVTVRVANDIRNDIQKQAKELTLENAYLKAKLLAYEVDGQNQNNKNNESGSSSSSNTAPTSTVTSSVSSRTSPLLSHIFNASDKEREEQEHREILNRVRQFVKNIESTTTSPTTLSNSNTTIATRLKSPSSSSSSSIQSFDSAVESKNNSLNSSPSHYTPYSLELKKADTSNKENIANRFHLNKEATSQQVQISPTSPTNNNKKTLPLSTSQNPDSRTNCSNNNNNNNNNNNKSNAPVINPDLMTLGRQTLKDMGGCKRNALLKWVQDRTLGYKSIEITNFSTSWNDGMALCALLHTLIPDEIPYEDLKPENTNENFAIAFKAAENLGITAKLDIKEFTAEHPAWSTVLNYIWEVYKCFEKKRDDEGSDEALDKFSI